MPIDNGAIFLTPPQQCISCNSVSGGWNTINPVTKSTCDELSGASSVPVGSPPEAVGDCSTPITAASCNEYLAIRSVNGVPVQVITPWLDLGGSGTVYVNACNMNQIGTPSSYNPNELSTTTNLLMDYSSSSNLISSCFEFGALHPELNVCVTGVQAYVPLTVSNVSIINTSPANPTSPSNYLIPITTIVGSIATIGGMIAGWWNEYGGGGGGGGTGDGLAGWIRAVEEDWRRNPNTTAAVVATLTTIGVVTGRIAISIAPPPFRIAGYITYIVIIYNNDNSEANSMIVRIPEGGA